MFKKQTRKLLNCLIVLLTQLAPVTQVWAQTMDAIPPNIASTSAKPMMMLTTSKDHTLFGPVYTDFEDLDDDGIVDFTFKPSFSYYGYFDSKKCYSYVTSSNRFEPSALATVQSDQRITCPTTASYWSGNFLNWATMTRLDVVRKMLYGGKRQLDSATETVLEGTGLSHDAHSFAKHYAGTDIRDYTPFSTANLTKAASYRGLTLCTRANANSAAGAPVIRMAKGNYSLWGVTSGLVCRWGNGEGGPGFATKLTNAYTAAGLGGSGVAHDTSAPNSTNDGATYSSIGPELNVRVKVCVSGLIGDERCTPYGSSTIVNKPTGLLQEFGISASGGSAKAEFGLITGSYDSNLEAGALRKNMGTFDSEIDASSGRFCHIAGGCSTAVSGGIAALDAIQLYGAGDYNGSNGLTFALNDEMVNGLFPSWGNPMGEMLLQALKYYAGGSVTTAAKNAGLTTGLDTALGLTTVTASNPFATSTTRDTAYGKPICRPLSILAISSSAVGYDRDFSSFSAFPNRNGNDASAYTNMIGDKEGITNSTRTVGSVNGGWGSDCSPKAVGNLSNVTGICPDLPGAQGSYLTAGAAFYANTNRVQSVDSSAPTDLPPTALTVKTYAAALRGGLGRVEVKIPGTNKYFYLTPESAWNDQDYVSGTVTGGPTEAQRKARYPATLMPGGILVFKALSSSATHGSFVVSWNDTQAGNDYDMDIIGLLRYDLIGSGTSAQVTITTEILDQSAGAKGSHGYSIVGTKVSDGKYITHGINGFANAGLCTGGAPCNFDSNNSSRSSTYDLKGVDNVTIEDPLWYAAKYGSFDTALSSYGANQTLTTSSWDAKRADGKACGGSTGVSCSDGVPDGYFLARRPELLERQLRDQLEQIVASSNSAPAVSSSQLIDGSFKYVAQFDPTLKKGSVSAYQLNSTGNFNQGASWDAGELLRNVDTATRQIITNTAAGSGVAFNWNAVGTDYQTSIKGTTSTTLDTRAQRLIDYMRGSVTNEAPNGERFQARSASNLLGTLVNSTPWIQTRPNAFFYDSLFPSNVSSYAAFARSYAKRDKVLWVGSNDGMLHGFKAETGAPMLSYVPQQLAGRLLSLATPSNNITAAVDGSPFTGDVALTQATGTSTWATYLFSSLGRGGKGLFALDVTGTGSSGTPTVASNLTESNAAGVFKWQFTSSNDSDLGFVLGDPTVSQFSGQASPIVRLNNGKFAVITPNGLNSGSGKAKLFLIGVDGPGVGGVWTAGTHYHKLETLATDSANGLLGASWIDIDGNGTADYIYGTDYKGNVWKFDIRDSSPSNWGSAFKSGSTNIPFYSITPARAISTAPVFGFPSRGGVMVSFGSGKAFSNTDFPTTTTNSMYGIYDRTGTTGTATFTLPTGTSTLTLRTLTDRTTGVTVDSVTPIDLAAKDGWYFNFPSTSESLLSNPAEKGQNITFNTVRAANTSENKCFYTPPGRTYLLDPINGAPVGDALGTYTDPSTGAKSVYMAIPSLDQKVRVTNDRSHRVTLNCTAEPQRCFCLANPTDAQCNCAANPTSTNCTAPACPSNTMSYRVIGKSSDYNICLKSFDARIQWREIPGLRTLN